MRNRPGFTVVSWTTHYRIIGGRYYRDAIARATDGTLHLVSYPEDVTA